MYPSCVSVFVLFYLFLKTMLNMSNLDQLLAKPAYVPCSELTMHLQSLITAQVCQVRLYRAMVYLLSYSTSIPVIQGSLTV